METTSSHSAQRSLHPQGKELFDPLEWLLIGEDNASVVQDLLSWVIIGRQRAGGVTDEDRTLIDNYYYGKYERTYEKDYRKY